MCVEFRGKWFKAKKHLTVYKDVLDKYGNDWCDQNTKVFSLMFCHRCGSGKINSILRAQE